MFVARKISRAKWNVRRGLADGEISADAVTGDPRTQGDTLSFWRCHTDASSEVEEAVLAIAAAGDRIDKLDVVWLADEKLLTDGLSLKDSRGRTPVVDLVTRHVDVCKLDYVRLGKVAHHVDRAIKDKRYRRFSKARVKKLLLAAIRQGRINVDDLGDGVRAVISG